MYNTILLTGVTGLIGSGVMRRLLNSYPQTRFLVMVRSPGRWRALAPALGTEVTRSHAIQGDLTAPGLGLIARDRALISGVDAIIHCAADVCFSRPLSQARSVNTEGTRRLLELAAGCSRLQRIVHVSTAFVVGRRIGSIEPNEDLTADGWVNAYEQSKAEAELLIRAAGLPWTILRPSTVVCDDANGRSSQYNAVHHALHLTHAGLTSMLPGSADSPVDVVTADYVSTAIAALALRADAENQVFHLCAGAGALTLGELFDRSYAIWSRDAEWRRRLVPRPAFADLTTYRMFEQTVHETADLRLRTIARALSHFAPQLAYGKHFDTTRTDAALGYTAPPVSAFWDAMVEQLLITRWGGDLPRAA